MDELNANEVMNEWKTPNSSEFGSLDNNCAKRLDFEETDEIINGIDDLELATNKCNHANVDGNDSGVDTGVTNPIQLQRALSNNSAGYASSSGGLDAQFASCNSSLLSVCSDSHDGKTTVLSCKGSIDCTSENGSESSSLSGDKQRLRPTPPKKRVGLTEPNQSKSPRSVDCNKVRARATSSNRISNGRNSGAPNLATTERARSRDKQITPNSQTSPNTKRQKPGSLPTSAKDTMTPNQKNSTLRRAASVTRRTPSVTPSTEDGRWPSNQFRSVGKAQNRATNETLIIKTKVGPIVLDNKPDRFSTMPRRKKVKSEEDLSDWRSTRSSSTTRDRMSSSTIVRRLSTRESPNKPTSAFPPRYQKPHATKTLIYHEASIQTALTSQDIDDAFDGNPKSIQIDAISTMDREIQVDIRDKEIEELQVKIKALTTENRTLRHNLVERSQIISTMEQQLNREHDEKLAMKQELQSNTARVLGMLELVHATPATETDAAGDSLMILESQIQQSGHALEEKQCEINKLRKFCEQLQAEMNRSIQVQRSLLEEKKFIEKETSELQDFLQDEKTAIFEALKDAEHEIEEYQLKIKQKEVEVERLQDECRHLVRISEQRRQEYLGMQTKCAAMESKSKTLLSQQSYAVSGAAVALSDLGTRLKDLVEQLVVSYNISEQELEDVIFHNEVYSNSVESSPENGTISPPRNHSFIAAIINAIKSAATTAKDKVNQTMAKSSHSMSHENGGDISEMLDSETEPCLMMENVLEDVSMPDSHTQNLISSSMIASMQSMTDTNNHQEDSLHNLCEAIANRQKIEQQTTLMMMNQSTHSEREANDHESNLSSSEHDSIVQSLVDHVINVDNLVTKLLKALRIIQMDNDNCIQQLINEKNSLQLNSEESADKLKDADEWSLKLKQNLEEKTIQLINNYNDLAQSQTELQKSRREISELHENICSLSALCSKTTNESETIPKDELLDALQRTLNESGRITGAEFNSIIRSIQEKIPNETERTNLLPKDDERTKLNGLESNSILQNGACDVKSQNDTIIKAIETLNGIQSIVRQCPALADLQRDLEEMLPSDFNANVE